LTGLTALVLAGSRAPSDPMAAAEGVTHKALIPIAGRPMIARVLDALRRSPRIARIVVSIEDAGALSGLAGDCEIVAAQPSPSLSVAAAMETLKTPLLLTTADHALLRPEWIAYFLAHLPDADVVAALARAETVAAAVPGAARTFLRFSGGAFSGCNLFYLADPRAENAVRFWREMESHRKEPLKLAARLGFATALRYATGTLALDDALARLSKLAGARAGIVQMPDGLAAVDVDKPDDLALVRRILESDSPG
jgi:GTP:adenosylcobinamide-phosphate guanylyltransferase